MLDWPDSQNKPAVANDFEKNLKWLRRDFEGTPKSVLAADLADGRFSSATASWP